MDGPPTDVYQAMIDGANAGFGGFNTWPHVVQFLLETYATDANIEKALGHLKALHMYPKETIKQFEIRLTTSSRELAGAYPQNSLVNRFIRKLPEDRLHSTQAQGKKFRRP